MSTQTETTTYQVNLSLSGYDQVTRIRVYAPSGIRVLNAEVNSLELDEVDALLTEKGYNLTDDAPGTFATDDSSEEGLVYSATSAN